MHDSLNTVIVGAGPYGLSLAAHLQAAGVRFRIFGAPMSTWREQMPQGMYLKSDGFASSLSDPKSSFTLKHFCQQEGIAYDDTRIPVRLETFTAYGMAFQQRFVPGLENNQVVAIRSEGKQFIVTLDDGETMRTEKVVLAVGITHFQRKPAELEHLPASLVTHSGAHSNLTRFRGQNVTVLGAGASGLDMAALLNEAGAHVTLIARAPAVHFHEPPGSGQRSLLERLRHPQTTIGPGLRSRFYTGFPLIFRRLPQALRVKIVRTHLRPAAGWPMKERVVEKFPLILGHSLDGAEVQDGRVQLTLRAGDGTKRSHTTEHVITATGYRPDLGRLGFLDEAIRSKIKTVEQAPALSANFESSVPGLYFVGLAAAYTFGPMLRFACGSDFTARHLATHLSGAVAQRSTDAVIGEPSSSMAGASKIR